MKGRYRIYTRITRVDMTGAVDKVEPHVWCAKVVFDPKEVRAELHFMVERLLEKTKLVEEFIPTPAAVD
jgi:hypothetical protein